MLALQHSKLVVTLKLPAEVIGICSIQNTVLPGKVAETALVPTFTVTLVPMDPVVVSIFEAVPLLTPVGRLLNLSNPILIYCISSKEVIVISLVLIIDNYLLPL
jgi:hypothetical protein